jgi:Ca-activated chloride channel family protein
MDINDPRLTAYSLNEMSPEERALFEQELAQFPAAAEEAAAFAAAASLLQSELAREAPAALTEGQHAAIQQASEGEKPAPPQSNVIALPAQPRSSTKLRGLLAGGTALMVAAGAFGLMTMRRSEYASSIEDNIADVKNVAPAPAASAKYKAAPAATAAAHAADRSQFDGKNTKGLPSKPSVAAEPALPRPGIPGSVRLPENGFIATAVDRQSTFSIDVDTASYSMVRSLLNSNQRPDASLVRIEEMINYFKYSYPSPDDAAFAVSAEVGEAPWAANHRLVRIGIKGREIAAKSRPPSNLVFLIDVSGSMHGADKIGLLKQGFSMLVDQLNERDSVSIVTYAGSSGVVLPPTKGSDRKTILAALEALQAGGGTNGAQGINAAYDLASQSFVEGGTNRVILATDGDFNLGASSPAELQKLIEDKAKTGVFLSVLGFGSGNYRDQTMETLADKGNGNYAYLDSAAEAKRVLVSEASGTLITIAKDVKIQVTWNPEFVRSFRLIGYENRMLAHQDFTNDQKDAGEIGAGHTVTALYELEPTSRTSQGKALGNLAIRFKDPDGVTSRQVDGPITGADTPFGSMSTDFRFVTGVAAFGMLLRGSAYIRNFGYAEVQRVVSGALGDDADGYRKELAELVGKAAELDH